ncbi:glycosyltransferase 87 family protein [Tsukamurella pulmonis]|uniref:glycosyltransferase 87 family protein n=1 Tax=Tsukamurella pulmonis TaxID=47312 RepID=UPI000A3F3692|nr:glycosyltransferase 87 family protein [Tsukamurella pulmonis]
MADENSRRFPRQWWVLALFAVAAAVAVWQQFVRIPFSTPMYGLFHNQIDAEVYRKGGEIVAHGGEGLYDGPLLNDILPFTYTPFAGVLFVPLSWMSTEVLRWVWTIAVMLALLACVLIALRLVGFVRDWRVWFAAICLTLVATVLEPVRTTIWFGQINVFLMLLLLWDLGRPAGARFKGFSIGIAAGIKLTPLFFLAYLVVTRQWREARTAIATLAGTVVIGFLVIPQQSWQYWSGTFLDANRVGEPNQVGNQSINGLIAYLTHAEEPSTAVWLAVAVPAALAGLGIAAWAYRRDEVLLAVTVVGLTACAVSPFSWGHHWVWIVPLLVLLIGRALLTADPGRRVLALVAAAALVAATFIWVTYFPHLQPTGVDDVHDTYAIGIFLRPMDNPVLKALAGGVYVWIFVATLIGSAWYLRHTEDRPALADEAVPAGPGRSGRAA